MRFPRITIAGLLGLVLVLGLGMAALRAASGYWASVMVTLALVALLAAVVGAWSGRNKAGWRGFAVFGWGYFVLAFGPWFQDDLRPYLLTSIAIVESYETIHKDPVTAMFTVAPPPGRLPGEWRAGEYGWSGEPSPKYAAIVGLGPTRVHTPSVGASGLSMISWSTPDFHAFELSAHAFFTILFGLLGTVVGVAVAGKGRDGRANVAEGER